MFPCCEMMVSTCRHGNYFHESAKGASGQSHYLLGMIVIVNDSLSFFSFFFPSCKLLKLKYHPNYDVVLFEKQTRMGMKYLVWKSLDFPVDQISTLTANWFILSLVSNWSRDKLSLNWMAPWLPVYKTGSLWYVSFVLVCCLCLDTIGPALLDLLGNSPPHRHAYPGVCVQLVSWLSLKEPCLLFLSSFPFIKMQKSAFALKGWMKLVQLWFFRV